MSINIVRLTQWAFDAKMTSYRRRCDVITSQRHQYDVILRHVPAGYTLALFAITAYVAKIQ